MAIILKSAEEIALMRQAGRIVAETIQALVATLRAGLTTKELDEIAHREILRQGGTPSFLGYRGYPATICVSLNDEVVHGIPGKRTIREGDVVSLDVGAIYQGFQGDAAVTVGVGKISPQAQRLIQTAEEALWAGIRAARSGAHLGDVSWAIQCTVEEQGFSVVREYVGHGIGRALHEEPQVPNFGGAGLGPILRSGMVIAIEPMVNSGDWKTQVGPDSWTVSTADGSISAHFEHTIAITDGAPEVLTALDSASGPGLGR